MTNVSLAQSRQQPTPHIIELSKYWIRDIGFSLRFKRIKPLNQLGIPDQLFAALLRADAEGAGHLLSKATLSELDELILLSMQAQFSRLLLDRACHLDLLRLMPTPAREKLVQLALKETAIQQVFESRLTALLRMLAEFRDEIVWIKGTSLAYTIYEQKCHRHSGDIDIVVKPPKVRDVVVRLQDAGFTWCNTPADCNQVGCGPTNNVSELFLSPCEEFVPTSSIVLFKNAQWPQIDLKVAPLDTGLRMRNFARFFSESELKACNHESFAVPNPVNHLIIVLHTLFKDRFASWKTLFDVHMLCSELSKTPNLWHDLVARCQLESLARPAWAGLVLSIDRFDSSVPDFVIEQLSSRTTIGARFTAFTPSSSFVWNSASYPMLLFAAIASEDRTERLGILLRSLLPRKSFLADYYNNGRAIPYGCLFIFLCLHWFVFLMPGGLTRRTAGKLLWPPQTYGYKLT